MEDIMLNLLRNGKVIKCDLQPLNKDELIEHDAIYYQQEFIGHNYDGYMKEQYIEEYLNVFYVKDDQKILASSSLFGEEEREIWVWKTPITSSVYYNVIGDNKCLPEYYQNNISLNFQYYFNMNNKNIEYIVKSNLPYNTKEEILISMYDEFLQLSYLFSQLKIIPTGIEYSENDCCDDMVKLAADNTMAYDFINKNTLYPKIDESEFAKELVKTKQ
jgi:hypothetical protein